MKNSFSIMKYIFCTIGLLIFAQAFYIYQEKRTFVEKADAVQGIVLGNSTNEKTIVSFITKAGKPIQFISDNSNNLTNYNEGENVEVLYDPENPNKAKINSFSTLYTGVSILGFFGAVFFLTGFSFFLSDNSKQKKMHFLQQNGKQIVTKFIDVQIDLNTTVNGSNPYFICSEWLDPKNNELYFFESDNIWFDPTDSIKKDEIKVVINPLNPKEYFMDISFLPVISK